MMMISHWASYVIFVGQSSVTQINGDHCKKCLSKGRFTLTQIIRMNYSREQFARMRIHTHASD